MPYHVVRLDQAPSNLSVTISELEKLARLGLMALRTDRPESLRTASDASDLPDCLLSTEHDVLGLVGPVKH